MIESRSRAARVRAALTKHRVNWPVRVVWAGAPALARSYALIAVLNAGMAVTLLAGGDARISSPAFLAVRVLGGKWTWGAVFAIAAAALLIAPTVGPRVMRRVLLTDAVVYLVWAISFVEAAWASPASALTGVVTSLVMSAWMVSTAECYRVGGPG